MKKRRVILLVVLIVIVISGVFIYREYNRENQDLSESNADAEIQAIQLIGEFEKSDSVANTKYRNKVLLVEGKIKSLDTVAEHFTIVLGEGSAMSSVRCLVDTKYLKEASGLVVGQLVKIRGAITGFKKDDLGIGSDVELNRCVVVK